MPELPDITAYLTALEPRVLQQPLEHIRITSPFLLRTIDPPLAELKGKRVLSLRRIGKRIVFGLEDDLWLVLHLMIAGRLHWKPAGAKLAGRNNLAAFDFPGGSLVLTEAGAKRRASLHAFRGEETLRALDPGGIDVFSATPEAIPQRAHRGESHPQACPHRSPFSQRHRQRLFRRDPLGRATLPHHADTKT